MRQSASIGFGVALCFVLAMGVSGPEAAAFPEDSNTIEKRKWTDEEIRIEIARLQLQKSVDGDEVVTLVVSGFLEIGPYWHDLDEADKEDSNAATRRRDEIREYLKSLPNVQASILADSVDLMAVERVGDWMCAIGYGCYPKGYVVRLGPVAADRSEEICWIFRRNDWFCAVLASD